MPVSHHLVRLSVPANGWCTEWWYWYCHGILKVSDSNLAVSSKRFSYGSPYFHQCSQPQTRIILELIYDLCTRRSPGKSRRRYDDDDDDDDNNNNNNNQWILPDRTWRCDKKMYVVENRLQPLAFITTMMNIWVSWQQKMSTKCCVCVKRHSVSRS